MKRRTIFLIGGGVLAAHVAFFWWIASAKVLPPTVYIPPPNFMERSAEMTDAKTGEKTIYREFTVSTRLSEASAVR